jgi:hypothetical protein
VLTPFWGTVASVSVTKAVLAGAGTAAGRALVIGDSALARSLAEQGFSVVLATPSLRVRTRAEYPIVRAKTIALPFAPATFHVLVLAGAGADLRGAAADATAAVTELACWLAPLAPGGRLVLVDRIDGGLLGARMAPTRQDLCAALLAARLCEIAQVAPRPGTVVTQGHLPG